MAEQADSDGGVPILSAVGSGNVALARYLLGLGVSEAFMTEDRWSLLHEVTY
jgi:hypothetical protein